jgi:leucyl-tRNA synthetase
VRLATLYAARPQRALNWSDSAVLRCHRFLTQVWDFSQAQLAAAAQESGEDRLPGADAQLRDTTEHLRVRLEKWCAAAVQRTTEEMIALEMHSAVRNVMRLFDRIKDFEKRVLARTGALSAADRDALLSALALLAQLLAPLSSRVPA